jgi:hypothetical protein
MRPLSADTSPDAEAVRFALYARMSPADKLARMAELTRSANALALAGLRRDYPDASDEELWLRLAVRRLGPELVARAYGWRAE